MRQAKIRERGILHIWIFALVIATTRTVPPPGCRWHRCWRCPSPRRGCPELPIALGADGDDPPGTIHVGVRLARDIRPPSWTTLLQRSGCRCCGRWRHHTGSARRRRDAARLVLLPFCQ